MQAEVRSLEFQLLSRMLMIDPPPHGGFSKFATGVL